MKPQFDHNVKASFGLWLDNLLLRKGETFKNITYALTKITNDELKDYDVFKSPHPQWVYDSSITGAAIPTGVTVNGIFAPRSDEIAIDYNNGRVLIDKDLNATTVSASYPYKEVAIYFSSLEDQKLIFENKFRLNPRTKIIPPTDAKAYVYPALFIKYNAGVNEPACFGGEDNTVIRIRTILFADSDYLFEGVCGILRDATRTCLPLLEADDLPFDKTGDFKDDAPNFDFMELMTERTHHSQNLMMITRVTVSPFSEEINAAISVNVVAGFVDFQIEMLRYPRI